MSKSLSIAQIGREDKRVGVCSFVTAVRAGRTRSTDGSDKKGGGGGGWYRRSAVQQTESSYESMEKGISYSQIDMNERGKK